MQMKKYFYTKVSEIDHILQNCQTRCFLKDIQFGESCIISCSLDGFKDQQPDLWYNMYGCVIIIFVVVVAKFYSIDYFAKYFPLPIPGTKFHKSLLLQSYQFYVILNNNNLSSETVPELYIFTTLQRNHYIEQEQQYQIYEFSIQHRSPRKIKLMKLYIISAT